MNRTLEEWSSDLSSVLLWLEYKMTFIYYPIKSQYYQHAIIINIGLTLSNWGRIFLISPQWSGPSLPSFPIENSLEGSLIYTLYIKNRVIYLTSLKGLCLHTLFGLIHRIFVYFPFIYFFLILLYQYGTLSNYFKVWLIIQHHCISFCSTFCQWELFLPVLAFINIGISGFIWVFTKDAQGLFCISTSLF